MKVLVRNTVTGAENIHNIQYLTHGDGYDTFTEDYEYVTLHITNEDRVNVKLDSTTEIVIVKS